MCPLNFIEVGKYSVDGKGKCFGVDAFGLEVFVKTSSQLLVQTGRRKVGVS